MVRSASLLAALALLGLLLTAPAGAGAAQRNLIAPPTACPGQGDPAAPVGKQLRAMHCMTNFARKRRGLGRLSRHAKLDNAARGKSGDILRCNQFAHEACGRDFSFWFERVGYRGRCTAIGENIAWGTGSLGSVRSIFSAWIRSPGHRANILGQFTELGIGLRKGKLEGNSGAQVWTQAFGSRRC